MTYTTAVHMSDWKPDKKHRRGERSPLVLSALWIAFFALLGQARAESADTALSAAIDGAWREPQSRARDAYRHQIGRAHV